MRIKGRVLIANANRPWWVPSPQPDRESCQVDLHLPTQRVCRSSAST